jgi:hypothetical protein
MFLYSRWLSLPITTRIKIASDFGIIKKGSTHVVDNKIQSDGYVISEVEEALTVPALQKYLNTDETDMSILWSMLVADDKYPDARAQPPAIIRKVGRPKKNA